jgi:hypothetical protein
MNHLCPTRISLMPLLRDAVLVHETVGQVI